ncbi:hypothetical protein WJ96_05120 [Burkholderia ubonensis]|uniref:Uncharacterized protein n=1 Tax=Burkholderia ubonensis TaxID=101571 RepID=A0AAW3MVH9_9BURK|nr:hypothetical protein [Burkholderia ubonensis]KVP75145.1 hypothetical protein WJ93_06940 [Burkholderia ubonensis]KVP96608.1 hypothetical protein WJ97_12040 [Burkholderia ubonensis]KVP97953.1 hypothetical protein WJ96_05120 [Burkholderia ubonensis]KVZ92650.1 hypothetical protein WL25_16775 [Burkholderia ubonensis]
MKEFFDSLDAKMLAFFKSKFGKTQKALAPLDPADSGAPIFIMLGSLTDCTMKDALAYARGLAETYITAPEIARIRVFDDSAHGRFVYELQEGGPGRSVIEKVLEQLDAGQKVRIHLTNGAQAVIEETHGEVFSLIYPASDEIIRPEQLPGLETEVDEGQLFKLEDLCGDEEMRELFPQNKKLVHIGGVILGVALSAFMLTGGIYTVVRSGMLDGDALLRQAKAGMLTDTVDNPVWQLDKARMAAEKDGQSLRALKKGPGGWSWELEK